MQYRKLSSGRLVRLWRAYKMLVAISAFNAFRWLHEFNAVDAFKALKAPIALTMFEMVDVFSEYFFHRDKKLANVFFIAIKKKLANVFYRDKQTSKRVCNTVS